MICYVQKVEKKKNLKSNMANQGSKFEHGLFELKSLSYKWQIIHGMFVHGKN